MSKALSLPVCVIFLAASCSGVKDSESSTSNLTARNEGYSLLYKLVSQEKDVDKILWIKSETPELQSLIEKTALAAKNAEERLRGFAGDDPTLELKLESLPLMEREARKAIQSTKTKELLGSSGRKFELRLLLTQAEGLSYGAHMADVLAQAEKHPTRKEYLGNLSLQLHNLRGAVMSLLEARTS